MNDSTTDMSDAEIKNHTGESQASDPSRIPC